jgi:hypothetical protein
MLLCDGWMASRVFDRAPDGGAEGRLVLRPVSRGALRIEGPLSILLAAQ